MSSAVISRLVPRVKAKLPWTVPIAVLWMLTLDWSTGVGFGPVSLSGAVTLAVAVLCLFLSPAIFLARHAESDKVRRGPIPVALIVFVYYAVVRVMLEPSTAGIQNVAVLVTFILTIGFTAISVTTASISGVGKALRISAVIASCVALAAQLAGIGVYGSRTFALAAIVFLAVLVPYQPKSRLLRFAPALTFVGIALSLSRTALAIAAVLLIFVAVRKRRGSQLFFSVILLGGGAAALLNWLIENYRPLHDRFMETGDGSLVVSGIAFNTSGRGNLWDLVLRSALESPIFGKGPGSASELVASTYQSISHPHNDYLRLLHDYGFVGLGLFCLGYFALLVATFKRANRSDETMHWSAFLGLAGVAVAALTDNVVIYPYAMVPLGVVVGTSLSMPIGPKLAEPARQLRRTVRDTQLSNALDRSQRSRSIPVRDYPKRPSIVGPK